ncbi:Zn-dependent alcohol dehydrogenase [Histidinibacterium lentulum]|uniref:Zn-dependent alcohol dehydrogenase n=1 Tax=Histidinibacterium lentulum TaxID=2480588 RepID=A0A3N2QSC7_9RHOB|nr:Zn-dependent alcohol dehydrogenase [Histidinibacterium lentulum]ROT98084.1 Zn-dependent alcohol dehydrogenase [Histidinibacterium lentulum]
MKTITAAVCRAFQAPLVLEEIEMRDPLAGEVEVVLEAVAICHSDLVYADGGWGGPLPVVLGHEAAGRISALGAGVRGLAEGDRVAVTLLRSCQHCTPCATGRVALCEGPRSAAVGPLTARDGSPIWQGMACGAFADRVVVDQGQVVKVPDTTKPEAAALLACGVITGVGAVVNTARLRAGQDAVVIGAGGVGLNAIQGARIAGARRIVAVDLSPTKLETARDFGATDTVLATDEAPWERVHEVLGRGADAVFVTVGAIPAFDAAPRYLATGGQVVMIGLPHSGALSTYEPVMLASLGQSMVGSKMGDAVIRRDIPWMLDLYEQGRLKLDELISARWPLERINEAMADTRAGAARRNVIVFPASG